MSHTVGDHVGYLYRCYDTDGHLIYIGSTADIYNRMNVHRNQGPFGDRIASVKYRICEDVTEARGLEREAIPTERPILNQVHNPDFEAVPRSQRPARFASVLATVPVSPEPPHVEDERGEAVVMAEMREAMNRVESYWYGRHEPAA